MQALELPLTGMVDVWCADASDGCQSDATFPESRFAPAADRQERYARAVAEGYRRMRSGRVVIAGLARNVAWALPQTIARIERLGSLFGAYRVVVYENDSLDPTPALLKQWRRRNFRVTVLSEIRHDMLNRPVRCALRAQRMAYYRNQYHQCVARRYADYDHVIVLDTDLAGGFSYDGIAHTFGQEDWDSVGSYGIVYKRLGLRPNCAIHYDAWAFRADDEFRPLSSRLVNAMHFRRGAPMVPVASCFGGLGVYRMEAFLAGRYGGGDCEHVALHRQMREAGHARIFLNPSQITIYGRKRRKMDRWVLLCQRALAACGLGYGTDWYRP